MLAFNLLSGPTLPNIGVFLGGLGTFLTAILAILRGKQFWNFLRDRAKLVSDLGTAKRERDEALGRERSLRSALESLQDVAKAMDTSLTAMKVKIDDMSRTQTVWLGYIRALVVRVDERADFARQHGVDLSSLPLPDVPEALRDVLG